MINKPKHLKSVFIHEIKEPATMNMLIWNGQQIAKKRCYKNLSIIQNRPPRLDKR
jgi:hypothetical protein